MSAYLWPTYNFIEIYKNVKLSKKTWYDIKLCGIYIIVTYIYLPTCDRSYNFIEIYNRLNMAKNYLRYSTSKEQGGFRLMGDNFKAIFLMEKLCCYHISFNVKRTT